MRIGGDLAVIEKLSADLPSLVGAKPKDDPARVKDAASQFESLLLAQILRSAREGGSSSWLSAGDDQSGESAMSLAEEYLATALAKSGGLGLSKLIASGLNRRP
jgi:Rod binding domain-containing protein